MKNRLIISSFPLIFLVLAACEQGPREGTREAQVMKGKQTFEQQCISCHGLGDVVPSRTDLETKAPDLTLIEERRRSSEFPVEEIARIIDGRRQVQAHGPREMPVWGAVYDSLGLDQTEIRAREAELVAFLMTIQK